MLEVVCPSVLRWCSRTDFLEVLVFAEFSDIVGRLFEEQQKLRGALSRRLVVDVDATPS